MCVNMICMPHSHTREGNMAMLAEAKRKQKWSNDPRNTNWTNDTSRFGYQMLTKMGWESGKGLGAKEDGATTHIKSVKRRDNLGLGADKSNEDNWLSHQLAFDDLLSTLNEHSENGTDDDGSKKRKKKHEMEKTARQSRKRVFYNRFIKSKDLSSKSAEDMACIFGQRSKSAPGTPQEQSEGEESDTSTASCPSEVLHGVQTINSGQSIKEYFERKMREMKAAREGKEAEGRKNDKEQFSGDEVLENNTENQETAEQESIRRNKKKDKKRKRKVEAKGWELGNDDSGSNLGDDEFSVKKKKKSAFEKDAKSEEESGITAGHEKRSEKRKSKKGKERKLNVMDSEMCKVCEVQTETKKGLTRKETKDGKDKGKDNKKKYKTVSSVNEEIVCDENERETKNENLKQSKKSVEDETCGQSFEEPRKGRNGKGKKRERTEENVVRNDCDTSEVVIKEEKKKKNKKRDKSRTSEEICKH